MFCVVCHVHNKQVLTKTFRPHSQFTHRSPWRSKTPGFLLCCETNKRSHTDTYFTLHKCTISVFALYRHLQPWCLPQAKHVQSLEILSHWEHSTKQPIFIDLSSWDKICLPSNQGLYILYYIICKFCITVQIGILFRKGAFNWSEVTLNTFRLLHKKKKMCLYIYIYIYIYIIHFQ